MLSFTHVGNQLSNSRKGLQFYYNLANLPSKVEGMSGSGNAGLTLSYGYLSDFGARFYDPFTARWTTRDPLAGKYHSLSLYNYCAWNPVNL